MSASAQNLSSIGLANGSHLSGLLECQTSISGEYFDVAKDQRPPEFEKDVEASFRLPLITRTIFSELKVEEACVRSVRGLDWRPRANLIPP